MKFTEDQLEQAVIALLGEQGYPHVRFVLARESRGAPSLRACHLR